MFIKKHATGLLIAVMLVFSCVLSDSKQTQVWRERSEKAFAQKNNAYGLLYALRAEQTAGLVDRFNLVKARVALEKSDVSPVVFTGVVITEFFSSFALFFPIIATQMMCLLFFLYVARLISLLGCAVACRENWGMVLFFLGLLVFLAQQYQLDGSRRAVLLPQNTVLVSGPAESFASVGSLKGPQAIVVREQSGGFSKIHAGFMSGWILSKLVKVV